MFALLNMALADASIACFAAKYSVKLWRPNVAIAWTDDGNPATAPEPGWTPRLAPATTNRPEYPAWPSCQAGAAHAVMTSLFGASASFALASSTARPGTGPRHFRSFREAARECGNATIYQGAHFRTSTVHGFNLGRTVAGWTLDHFLLP